MLFSVVIPTCNRSSYLKRCIHSLIKEIHSSKNIEVFVVDDGSSEDERKRNREICSGVGVHYIMIPNKGPGPARNAGIKRSKGEWVVFLDDDVEVVKGWYGSLEKSVRNVATEVIGLEGVVIPTGNGVWDREVQNLNGNLYLTCHMIYRRSILKQVGGFSESETFRKAEDHFLAARMLQKGRVVFLPELKVMHLPRTVPLCRYLFGAFGRMDSILIAEEDFFLKEPVMYRYFRYADTFWGTYRSKLFLHLVSSLRRRDLRRLLSHPIQTLFLTISLIVEQLRAWMLLPGYLFRYRDSLLKQTTKKGDF